MTNQETSEKALRLACNCIADGPQKYHEANTPEGWVSVFTLAAQTGKTVEEVLADQPAPQMMTEAERSSFNLHVDATDARLTA